MSEITVYVKTKFIGFHRWTNAPDDDISYLRSVHRHVFGVTVFAKVSHDDRDIEFHQLKKEVDYQLRPIANSMQPDSASSLSCEQVAETLKRYLSPKYGDKIIAIEIDEDGECGTLVRF